MLTRLGRLPDKWEFLMIWPHLNGLPAGTSVAQFSKRNVKGCVASEVKGAKLVAVMLREATGEYL